MGRSVAAGLGFGLALGVALTGCIAGASRPSPTDPHPYATTTTVPIANTNTVTTGQGLADYRSCMSDEGVAVGEIEVDGLGRPRIAGALSSLDLSDRSVLDALQICGHHLSSGPLDLSSDPRLRDLIQESLKDFAECVRLEGVGDYPDPVPGFDGTGSPFPVALVPWNDPGLERAVSRCGPLLRGS